MELRQQFVGAVSEVENHCEPNDGREGEGEGEGAPKTTLYVSKTHVRSQHASSRGSIATHDNSLREGWNGATVVWRDVTVTIKGKRKYSEKVISTSTGYALKSTITGIMGPARCGKSTLLRALSDFLPSHAKVYGEISINGMRGQLNNGSFAFITKHEQLVETLTVQETLQYSTLLQLPNHVPLSQRLVAVDEVMGIMELADVADVRVGGLFHAKGLSTGHRRRLYIGLELLTKPSLVLVDDPIHSLDSISATMVMLTLKRLSQTGCTVVLTIQNCNAEVFRLLDKTCLMANGKTVFFGEPLGCLEHFSNAGFPCPLLCNPSDHLINALNNDYKEVIKLVRKGQDCDQEAAAQPPTVNTALIIQTLETAYKSSNEAAGVEALVTHLLEKEGQTTTSKDNATCIRQLMVLTWRSFLHMLRDWQYFWLRLLLSIFFMACLGTVFIGFKQSFSVQKQIAAIFFMVSFLCLLGIGGFQALSKDLKVHAKESSYGHAGGQLGTCFFILANLLSSLPFLFLMAILCSTIAYSFLMLNLSLESFIYFTTNVFLCLIISESLMMVIATILPRILEGVVTVVLVQGMFMLLSGYFRRVDEVPEPMWKYPASYISFYAYSLEGILQNELLAINADSSSHRQYDVQLSAYTTSSLVQGKWNNVLVLVAMAFAYRVSLLVIIKSPKAPIRSLKAYNV